MGDFKRRDVGRWHQEVPGARWFKADLHIHTLDDLPGRRVKVPSGVTGDLSSDESIRAYARLLLQAAVQRGVGVLALTPHSARMAPAGDASAVWGIVDEWNDGVDDDGEPFRSKVYAVFPGFEPSLGQGKSGVHLLFLFDPEIGRANYLRAFDLVMDQRFPWKQNELQLSGKTAKQAFAGLRDFHREHGVADGSSAWDYLVLAPHIDNDKGVFGAQKGQILAQFPKTEIAGLELPDEKLPDDALSNRPWLREDLERHHLAFFHGSDAYSVGDIGRRFTWVKLARPRIDGLRTGGLDALGMSATVQQTFRDAMPSARQRALATIRCADRYLLELEVGGEYRRLDDLSGGQRVSVLLSLLLETTDQRPLVVDQPEDELDNRFLFDTVLPAVKRLKGRRQIIVATHNPNIVVNGDADQVIQLEATANNGSVAQAGAIEDTAVREAIMRTVDGGAEAFRLRRMKYGF